MPNGTVYIRWNDSVGGWRSPRRLVQVQDESGRDVSALQSNDQNSILIPDLSSQTQYKLTFAPSDVPAQAQKFSTILVLRKFKFAKVHHSPPRDLIRESKRPSIR